MASHPYKNLPDKSFWKRAIANRHYEDMEDLWDPPQVEGNEKFATAGSCFAQHIGRHISERGSDNYLDLEPAPIFLPPEDHSRYGFGVYSCRYGNIYTSTQLLQLLQEALGKRPISSHVWERGGRYYDALRPSVDPIGQETPQMVTDLRRQHLKQVKEMFNSLDVMVFTLGLTEAWISTVDGTAFPTAPGVIAGSPEEDPATFKNLGIDDVRRDIAEFWSLLRSINPTAKLILTVSPVPLIATATHQHVLPATNYSKSVLRVAAHEASSTEPDIHYFPSYEIINSAQGHGYYFDPDQRSVNDRGVQYVMSHFFTGHMSSAFPEHGYRDVGSVDVICDEEAIETDF